MMKRVLGAAGAFVLVSCLGAFAATTVACGSSSSDENAQSGAAALQSANVAIDLFDANGSKVGEGAGVLIAPNLVLTSGHLIAGKAKEATLERLLEQAFEAGIDCVLTHARADPEPPESDEDAELSRAVLKSLIEHSAARRLMGREVLSRAIVATLIQQAASAREGPAAH